MDWGTSRASPRESDRHHTRRDPGAAVDYIGIIPIPNHATCHLGPEGLRFGVTGAASVSMSHDRIDAAIAMVGRTGSPHEIAPTPAATTAAALMT